MSLVKESWQFKYDEALITENLERVLEMGTLSTFQKASHWYAEAHLYASKFAAAYDKPVIITSALISVLSPQKDWFHNLKLTEDFLKSGGEECGHLKGQVWKAKLIYNHTDLYAPEEKIPYIERMLGGNKTQNFFRNILDPLDREHVTLDFHMCQLLTGNFGYKSPTDKQYQFLKEVLINFARNNNRIPSQLQAELWLIWKENKHS